MNKLLLTILSCLLPFMLLAQTVTDTANMDVDTTGQRDLIDIGRKLIKIKPHNKPGKKEIFFSVLPLSSSVPGGSKALVTSTTAGFYLGDRTTTYISSV